MLLLGNETLVCFILVLVLLNEKCSKGADYSDRAVRAIKGGMEGILLRVPWVSLSSGQLGSEDQKAPPTLVKATASHRDVQICGAAGAHIPGGYPLCSPRCPHPNTRNL